SDFAEFCNAKHAVGVGSGTDALYLGLRALGVGPGDEVITVPNTFIATVSAINMAGAKPVFVDIDAGTYLMDTSKIQAAITERTKALLPVHLYGQPVAMDRVRMLAKEHGLAVLEDACQAHGAEYRGTRTGTLGDVAAYSFYYSKNIGAYGEGGVAVTDSRDIATQLQLLRNHGSSTRYQSVLYGMNSRLDEIQAAVLRIKLRHLERWNETRRALAAEYNRRLAGLPGVTTPVEAPDAKHVYHLYVIRVQERDELLEWLKRHGVHAGIHYPVPIHLQEACRDLEHREGDFPVAERVAKEIISLPIYPELTIEDLDYICQTIGDFFDDERTERPRAAAASEGGTGK
ncbi:MAG: DegT/DnrJ/EryC1/StrS family aminotransferase, partial [Chloroflexi bacterium]|nr:DegT/DnrJ/EryC1/StrS family aminotransferase [Chloroflexota bacterium]